MTNDDDAWAASSRSAMAGGGGGGLVRTQSINIDLALANEVFDHFCSQANTLKSILRSFSYLCEILRLKPTEFPYFYPKIKSKLKSWKAQALWAKFDKRASHKIYNRGKACAGQRMLVIGAGPCGLRTAIEAQLLGAKVVVIEKRDRFSRNNVLHLWPYNIHDLRGLGAKKFYGKFCAGAIDHISIRQLQCILLKVALVLGVEIYDSIGFEGLIEPTDVETGWRALVSPSDHPVSQYEFDVLIGADGKRNTLHGFKRKEFRGKLAIAVTANFIRRHDEAESQVEEISGVAFIFNQKFFNDLNEAKGIDLENIVYYKDETHYFVMTAKKHSLLEKGVIIRNDPDTAKLLSPENIRAEKLFEYAREAADFATNYQLPHLDFAVNHYGKPDVAMFDFTSMFQAENSCRVIERHGHRLLVSLVGDSLLEPFWPTGTGCARGFFGGLDACWLMRQLALGKMTTLEAIAERESIYRLLPQTTPENTSKDYSSYTCEPQSRYPTLNTKLVLPFQITQLVDTDNPSQLEEELRQSNSTAVTEPRKRRRKESHVSPDTLQNWLSKQVEAYESVSITDMTTSFQSGLALCAIIHRYRPDLIDFTELDRDDRYGNIQLAFDVLEYELGISPAIPAAELADLRRIPDKLTMMSYLSQVYECFRKDIPAVNRMSVVGEDDDDILEAQFRQPANRPMARRGRHDPVPGGKMSIGQLVASEAAKKTTKKRRSKESIVDILDNDDVTGDKMVASTGGSTSNKENVIETARLNRSAHRKRLLRLMERAENSAAEKKAAEKQVRKSIKEEERYKVIEAQFGGGGSGGGGGGGKRRSGGSGNDIATKYRENKRPKDLKRAIGKLDKDDWNIKNIEEKLLMKKDPEGGHRDKVPKWSKAAFQDKFNIMKGKLENGEDNPGSKKYADIDSSLARLQRKLREGSALETGQRGSNRVSALAEELFESRKLDEVEAATLMTSSGASAGASGGESKAASVLDFLQAPSKLKPGGGGSEICHFCAKRVYVVERMSAESKFFHRSCFRCDYCNVLLRLGSYVYHREGQFAGKFFCIPHSTENSLEKYRYRRKADEIRDAELRQRELIHRATNDWNRGTGVGSASAPTSYLDSLTPAHKERLISSLDANMRGTTPERAEFEASIDQQSEEEAPSIMDEDEWTDRNFGNSLLLDNNEEENENTSEDSMSELDSDVDSSDDERKAEEEKLLTSLEARQLQKEWMKRYNRRSKEKAGNSDDEEDVSQYDNVPKERLSSDDEDCEVADCEAAHEADYEDDDDDDDDSGSSSEDSDSGNARLPQVPSVRKRVSQQKRRRKTEGTSTEVDSDEDDSSSSSGSSASDSDSSEAKEKSDSEFGSGSNTECEFTDSEGKPNPFHKELEVPKIVIEPGSPNVAAKRHNRHRTVDNTVRHYPMQQQQQTRFPAPQYVSQRIGLETRERSEPNLQSMTSYASRLQYKTPNISGRLNSEDTKQQPTVTRSTQKALNLKKNWVSDAPTSVTATKKVDAAEMDSRLKSLMERLSSQQSLLRPADKPSTQMEHLLKNLPSSAARAAGLGQSNSVVRDPGRFKSPPPVTGSATSGLSNYHSYPSPYPTSFTSSQMVASVVSPPATQVLSQEPVPLEDIKVKLEKDELAEEEEAPFTEAESIPVPEQPVATDTQVQLNCSCNTNSSSEDSSDSSSSSSESTQSENLSPVPPPVPPLPLMVPDIQIHTDDHDHGDHQFHKESESRHEFDSIPFADGDEDDEFQSCVNESESIADAADASSQAAVDGSSEQQGYHTPGNDLDESSSQADPQIFSPPLATSSPLSQTPEKHVVKLTDDEVTRIYKERNPLERLAQLNSLKQRESSVVRDMILGRVNAGSRASNASASTSTNRSAFGVRRPRNMILSTTVPPPPKDDEATALPMSASSDLSRMNQPPNFYHKSLSCHQLERLMDFPLIDADEIEPMSTTAADTPIRPVRRQAAAKSPTRPERRTDTSKHVYENVPLPNGESTPLKAASKPYEKPVAEDTVTTTPSMTKNSPVSKMVSLPATPLTDPEKFGIPVRNTTKHHRKKTSSSGSKPTEDNLGSSSNVVSPTAEQKSISSNDFDNMDGIVSSDGGSAPNSPAKRVMSQSREPKKTFMQAITGMFGRGTTPDSRSKSPESKSTEAERKSRSDSFMKFAKGFRSPPASNNASMKSSPSSPEAPRADISELSLSSNQSSMPNSPTKNPGAVSSRQQNGQDTIYKKISIQASHPSTPPIPLSRKISLKHAAANSEDDLSDDIDDGEGSPETSLAFVTNNIKAAQQAAAAGSSSSPVLKSGGTVASSLPPEILEKILRRGGKSAKRAARVAQLKRVRRAQEIQRQLEELDVKHKDLEERGVRAEQNIRGETSSNVSTSGAQIAAGVTASEAEEADLMQTWFLLLAEKNALVRTEQELLVQAKQLELEDRAARLEVELRDHLLRDSRSPESVSREGEILDELLEISEQRETLQSMLVRDKMRYQMEDKDIEAQMRAKGIRVTPIRKIHAN